MTFFCSSSCVEVGVSMREAAFAIGMSPARPGCLTVGLNDLQSSLCHMVASINRGPQQIYLNPYYRYPKKVPLILGNRHSICAIGTRQRALLPRQPPGTSPVPPADVRLPPAWTGVCERSQNIELLGSRLQWRDLLEQDRLWTSCGTQLNC